MFAHLLAKEALEKWVKQVVQVLKAYLDSLETLDMLDPRVVPVCLVLMASEEDQVKMAVAVCLVFKVKRVNLVWRRSHPPNQDLREKGASLVTMVARDFQGQKDLGAQEDLPATLDTKE